RGGEAREGDAVFARAHAVGRDELEAFEAHAVAVEVEVELAAGEDQALVDQREHEFAALDAAAGTRAGIRAADIEAAGEAARGVDVLARQAAEPGDRGHVEPGRAADRGLGRHAPHPVGAAAGAQASLALHAAELLAAHVEREVDA